MRLSITVFSAIMLILVMLNAEIFYCYAECHCAECHYVKCHYAECYNAECLGALHFTRSEKLAKEKQPSLLNPFLS